MTWSAAYLVKAAARRFPTLKSIYDALRPAADTARHMPVIDPLEHSVSLPLSFLRYAKPYPGYNPSEVVYRGTMLPSELSSITNTLKGRDLFSTPHPAIAAGYSATPIFQPVAALQKFMGKEELPPSVVLEIALKNLVNKGFSSPHAAAVSPTGRYMVPAISSFVNITPGSNSSGQLLDYERVLPLLRMQDIRRFWRPVAESGKSKSLAPIDINLPGEGETELTGSLLRELIRPLYKSGADDKEMLKSVLGQRLAAERTRYGLPIGAGLGATLSAIVMNMSKYAPPSSLKPALALAGTALGGYAGWTGSEGLRVFEAARISEILKRVSPTELATLSKEVLAKRKIPSEYRDFARTLLSRAVHGEAKQGPLPSTVGAVVGGALLPLLHWRAGAPTLAFSVGPGALGGAALGSLSGVGYNTYRESKLRAEGAGKIDQALSTGKLSLSPEEKDRASEYVTKLRRDSNMAWPDALPLAGVPFGLPGVAAGFGLRYGADQLFALPRMREQARKDIDRGGIEATLDTKA
jgi:hypothetical protein